MVVGIWSSGRSLRDTAAGIICIGIRRERDEKTPDMIQRGDGLSDAG